MATIIPPHFNDRFISQRYNRALHFVQNLPATSNFQPSKSQKLQLYALYKQVSVGDVNSPRPGLFDVVGRAKWDAWKKLEGISIIEARHMYVEALLKCAAEAYKKNIGREEAQRIIRAFAMMKPDDDDESDDLLSTDDTSNQEDDDDDDTSIGSEDAEEKAYLRDIEDSTTIPFVVPDNTTSYGSPDNHTFQSRMAQIPTRSPQKPPQQMYKRPESAASIQTMVTAPTTPHQFPTTRPPSVTNSISSGVRSRSNASSRLGQYRGNERRISVANQVIKEGVPNNPILKDEYIDDNINPWQQIPPSTSKRYYPSINNDDDRSQTPTERNKQAMRLASPMYQSEHLQRSPPSPSLYAQHQHLRSPLLSASSSVTATPHNKENRASMDSSTFEYTATVALGPATKRALEALQNEVIALNDRIDGLRRELVESDKQRSIKKPNESTSFDRNSGWNWILKVVLKYAGINLATALVLFIILYKSKSPIAFAILGNMGLLKKD